MARSDRMPKFLRDLAQQYPDRVQSIDVEFDEWDGPRNPYSYWMWLQPGWSPDGERHCIHEPNKREFMEVWRRVERCDCHQCREALQEAKDREAKDRELVRKLLSGMRNEMTKYL